MRGAAHRGVQMGRKLVALIVVVAAGLAVDSAAAAPMRITLRYCQAPEGPGAYVAATRNVPCATAMAVAARITNRSCWAGEQCDIRRFVCISYWDGQFTQPFSFTHHAICTAPRGKRIEFDLG